MTSRIPIEKIDVPNNRARDFSEQGAQALAAIIAAQGLQHPISVRAVGERYQLISGLHRLRAFEINGETEIPARLSDAKTDDQARLEEVMENLGRNELIALDRCHHLYELKQVYERMHPQAKNGGDRGNQHTGGRIRTSDSATNEGEVFGFARSVSEKLGLGRSQISAAVKIWTGLTLVTRQRLVGLDIARKQTELKLLSEQKPQVQGHILDLITDPKSGVTSVGEALASLEGGVQATPLEKRFRTLSDGLKALPEPTLDRLLLENEERVIAALKRLGRI